MAWPRRRHCRGICQSFEWGEDVLDAGPDLAVRPVVVVADDAAGSVPGGCDDGGDGTVAAVAEDDALAGEQMRARWLRGQRPRRCGCRASSARP